MSFFELSRIREQIRYYKAIERIMNMQDTVTEDRVRKIVREELAAAAQRPMKDDPAPEPVKDLRWLVERHEWAFKGTLDSVPHANDQGDIVSLFWWRLTDRYINHEAALTVVRGIVDEQCCEACRRTGDTHYIRPWDRREGVYRARIGPKWLTKKPMSYVEVALLTVMRENK